jgi:hypothetical protein
MGVVLPPFAAFQQQVLTSLTERLDAATRRAIPGIRQRVAELVGEAVQASPTYASLLNGRLWHVLGLTDPGQALAAIVKGLKDGVEVRPVRVRLVGQQLEGGAVVRVVRGDFANLLQLEEATFTTPEHHYELDWLRWLLFEGDAVIIPDHAYIGKITHFSRTGQGLMVKSRRGWRIPDEHQGTQHDNWITRSLVGLEGPVGIAIEEQLRKQL